MQRTTISLISGFALLCFSTQAQPITPVSQNRFVQNTTQSITAADFGPFVASVPGASQNSQILPNMLTGTASIGVNDNNRNAQSHFEVTFDLSAPITYQLEGSVAGTYATASCTSSVTLLDSLNQPIFDRTTNFLQWTRNFNVTDTLPAGQYTLRVDSTGFNGDPIGGFAVGSYNVTFSIVPEPATLASLAFMLCAARFRRSVG